MFEKKKTKEELQKEKERAKLKKAAKSVVKEQEIKKKRAERILDKDFVEKRLGYERKKDEKKAGLRDTYIQEVKDEVLSGEKDVFCNVILSSTFKLYALTSLLFIIAISITSFRFSFLSCPFTLNAGIRNKNMRIDVFDLINFGGNNLIPFTL